MAKHSGSGGYKPGFKPKFSEGALSAKAGLAKLEFQESLHPRGPGGKFADKPGGEAGTKAGGGTSGSPGGADKSKSSPSPAKIDLTHELTIVAKGNPKKGTAAARYALYKPGMSVQDYVAAIEKSGLGDKKQALRDLAWDIKQGWISAGPKKALAPTGPAGVAVGAAGTATAGLGAEAAAAATAAKSIGQSELVPKPTAMVAAEKALAPAGPDIAGAKKDFESAKDFSKFDQFDDEVYKGTPLLGAAINKNINFNDNALVAVGEYTDEWYEGINAGLRLNNGVGLDQDQKRIVGQLDKILEKGSVPEDLVLHRVVKGADVQKSLESLKPGGMFTSQAFTSTTLHPDTVESLLGSGEGGPVPGVLKMQILARKGTSAAYLEPHSTNEGELEVLLPRGAKLLFLGKKGDTYQFEYGEAVKKADLPKLADLELAAPKTTPEIGPAAKAAGFTESKPLLGSSLAPIDASTFKKTGPQLGSNPGGTYEAPDGSRYYVKQAKSLGHAENELLADDLYKTLGVETLAPRSFTFNGGPATGSKIEKLTEFDPFNPAHVAEAQKNFATHAFLANWDAVGLEYDNLAFNSAGKLTMLDGGGALRFRAQGGDKPNFNGSVGEMDSLRSESNEQAFQVFGSMTSAQIRKSAEPVLKLTDADIDAAVKRQVTDPTQAANYAKVLKARRDDIAARVGLPAPVAAPAAVAPTVAPPATGTKSKVPLASGVPVKASTNPDPIPLGAKIELGDKLHFEVQGNPKKSTAAVRFDLYKDGMTLQDYVDAVGDKKQALKDVAWDLKQGWISASKAGATAPAAFGKAETLSTGAIMAKAGATAPAPKPPAASPPVPAPAPAPLASTKAQFDALSGPDKVALTKTVVGEAAAGGILATKPTIVPTPSELVAFEKPNTGSTALFKATNEGLKDSYVVNTTQISDTELFGVKTTLGKAEKAALQGTASSKAGAEQIVAAIKSKMIDPDGSILIISNTNGSYSGAVAATVAGDVARIDHLGEFVSGQGPHLIDKLSEAAASAGIGKLVVNTKASEFYLKNGFTPTGVKDTYELNIGAKASAYAAANASVGIQTKAAAGDKATLDVIASIDPPQAPTPVSPSTTVSTVGSVTVGKTSSGHIYDVPGGGGVATLDPNTINNKVIGSSVKYNKLDDDQYVGAASKLAEKIQSLKAGGALDGDSELAAANKAFKIALQSDVYDPSDANKLFGFSLGSTGAIKGAIAAQTSPQSKSVVVTDHAGLGGGGGKEALDSLIYAAQAAGKDSILVKSGLTAFYTSQGFSASLDHNGYLKLDIQPTTYKKPNAVYTGAHSVLAEHLAKQIIKPSAVPNTAKVNSSGFKVYKQYDVDYANYKKATYDKPLDYEETYSAKQYSGNGSYELNKALYEGKTLDVNQKITMEKIDAAITKSSFKEDHLLYRALGGEDVKNMFATLQPGDIYSNPGFSSTSIKPSIYGAGQGDKTSMKIYARKGAKGIPIEDISNYPEELETILPRNAPLRYIGKDLNGYHEFEYI